MGKEFTSSLILIGILLGEFVRYSEAEGTETNCRYTYVAGALVIIIIIMM